MTVANDRREHLLRKVHQRETLDQQEAAEFVGTTRSVVAVTERRALEKLRDALGDDAIAELIGGAA